jgi:hypothetical protein
MKKSSTFQFELHMKYKDPSNKKLLVSDLGEWVEAAKIVPVGTQAGIPLLHQPVDHICKELYGELKPNGSDISDLNLWPFTAATLMGSNTWKSHGGRCGVVLGMVQQLPTHGVQHILRIWTCVVVQYKHIGMLSIDDSMHFRAEHAFYHEFW